MIFHFSNVQIHFFVKLISLYFFHFLWNITILCLLLLYFDKIAINSFLLLSLPMDQSRDVTPRLGECGWFLIFDCLSPFYFLLIEFHYAFSISYIVQTCYVYDSYCIWFNFNTHFSCFLAGLLLFSPKVSVTGCDSSLGSFCYSPVYFSSRSCIFFPATVITTM